MSLKNVTSFMEDLRGENVANMKTSQPCTWHPKVVTTLPSGDFIDCKKGPACEDNPPSCYDGFELEGKSLKSSNYDPRG